MSPVHPKTGATDAEEHGASSRHQGAEMTTNAREEAAARAMAAAFEYPWEPMTEQGRENMRKNARAVLAAADGVGVVPAVEVCACRWAGSEQTQFCELHRAHKDAIHEWAERAKTAESRLAAIACMASGAPAQPRPPASVSDEQIDALMGALIPVPFSIECVNIWNRSQVHRIVRAALAKFGGGVPEGWSIERIAEDQRFIRIVSPLTGPGVFVVGDDHSAHAAQMLHALAAAMLAAAPQPDAGAGREGEEA